MSVRGDREGGRSCLRAEEEVEVVFSGDPIWAPSPEIETPSQR